MGHQQMTLFGEMYEKYTIKKPIKLTTLFSGIGAQEKALELLGANFEIHKTCEWAVPSIKAYKAIHSSFLKNMTLVSLNGQSLIKPQEFECLKAFQQTIMNQ